MTGICSAHQNPVPGCEKCDATMNGMKSLLAIRMCAGWLSLCIKLGWSKDALDELEALWWKYHDEQTGDFKEAKEEK